MSNYRFIADCFIGRYYSAGDVASTADVGGTEWDYRGTKVRLHERCQYPWIDAYEASRSRADNREEP